MAQEVASRSIVNAFRPLDVPLSNYSSKVLPDDATAVNLKTKHFCEVLLMTMSYLIFLKNLYPQATRLSALGQPICHELMPE